MLNQPVVGFLNLIQSMVLFFVVLEFDWFRKILKQSRCQLPLIAQSFVLRKMSRTYPDKLFAEVWQASPDKTGAVAVKSSNMAVPRLLGAIVQADSIMISCSKLKRAYLDDFDSDVVFIVRKANLPVKYLRRVLNLVCQHRTGLRVLES